MSEIHPLAAPACCCHRGQILAAAALALRAPCEHITDVAAPLSAGGPHDFYSNADYWWPNPDTPDGLPYVGRDGETNPGNFIAHRMAMRRMRTHVAALAAAYRLTGEGCYSAKACRFLQEFFIDEKTRMAPHLLYAQAIPRRQPWARNRHYRYAAPHRHPLCRDGAARGARDGSAALRGAAGLV